jgi:hypothetical protein
VEVEHVEERRGARREADADAGGEDLREAVEAEHAPGRGEERALEREVGRRARGGAVVEVVVRVVCAADQRPRARRRGGGVPSRMSRSCASASWSTSVRRSSVAVAPVGLQPYCRPSAA